MTTILDFIETLHRMEEASLKRDEVMFLSLRGELA